MEIALPGSVPSPGGGDGGSVVVELMAIAEADQGVSLLTVQFKLGSSED